MITTKPFGRTGHDSSRVIFGGAGLGLLEWGFDWAAELLDTITAAGVNHIDTAASYGDSELLLAPWLTASTDGVTNRNRVFLATKTGERDGVKARAELEQSLERLGVDQVDLVQLHNLVEDDEWDVAHGTGGVVEAMIAARDEGLVRFIGVTGHGVRIPGMHVRSLGEFDYDSVLFPYNFTMMSNPVYRHDVDELLSICAERNVAAQTIKSIARRRWVGRHDTDVDEPRSWYQPLRDAGAIHRAMQYVLGNDQIFLNTSSDTRLMHEMLAAATELCAGDAIEAPSDDAMAADVETFNMKALFDGAELELIKATDRASLPGAQGRNE